MKDPRRARVVFAMAPGIIKAFGRDEGGHEEGLRLDPAGGIAQRRERSKWMTAKI